jgi:glycosyltransferase involved in cell wall biosynthesis
MMSKTGTLVNINSNDQHNDNQDLKILIIDFSRSYGGASTRVISLLQNLPYGQVSLAGLANSPVMESANSLGVRTHNIGINKLDIRILRQLVNIIKQEGYQIIDTHNIQAKFWGSLAALITDTILVSTIHSWYALEHGKKSIKGRFYTFLELITNQKLGAYITVSKKDRDMLIQSKVSEDDIELIYNAVAVDPAKIPDNRERLQAETGIPVKGIICTAVGRLVNVKGYDILIEAFRRKVTQLSELYCVIVGDGELNYEYRQRVQETGLEKRVHFLGYQPHDKVLSILKGSDIFVMPSRYEGTPIALLEAAALGKAIVASHVGGIPELVADGEQALLVHPDDAPALADKLVYLAQNKESINRLGQEAQKRIQENFSLSGMVEKTYDTYLKAWHKKFPIRD